MRTVRILGSAKNVRDYPTRTNPEDEVWTANSPATVQVRCPRAMKEWTRWFNLHSKKHIMGAYPSVWDYFIHKAAGRPVVLLKRQPDLPTSVAFPREAIQAEFATAKGPNRYFTCTVCWLIALAIFEKFDRIELWGYELRDTKPGFAHAWERPCFFYWIQMARSRGVEVWYQKEIERLPFVPGDADAYTGTLYGYDTKPEDDWDIATQTWKV